MFGIIDPIMLVILGGCMGFSLHAIITPMDPDVKVVVVKVPGGEDEEG